jgi:hypothetical protein
VRRRTSRAFGGNDAKSPDAYPLIVAQTVRELTAMTRNTPNRAAAESVAEALRRLAWGPDA